MTGPDLFSIKGKVVIVTGAGRGIGREIALAMASRESVVYAVDLAFHGRVINGAVCRPFDLECDITVPSRFERVCRMIYGKHKRIDVLINNAGVTYAKRTAGLYSQEDWHRTINVNLTAAFNCSQEVLKYMSKRRRGSIVNITSLNAERGFPGNPAYVASKGGLKMLGKALARDWGPYNIRVNNLGPGYIRTRMTEKSYKDAHARKTREAVTMLGRWGRVRDLIGPCIFLASDASAYITGQDIYVDGGWLANGLPDIDAVCFAKKGR